MLTRRLLLIKMKKIHMALTAAFVLFTLIYLLRKNKTNNELESDFIPPPPSDQIHIFYDGSFRNKEIDGKYQNWFHYNKTTKSQMGTPFYPSLGLYSSNDETVLDKHMQEILLAGIGVIIVSWWPPTHPKAPPMDLIIPYAEKYGLKVSIQLENYEGRTIQEVRKQLILFFKLYGQHPALYKTKVIRKSKPLPIIYIQDSNLIPYNHWFILFGYTSNHTLRGTAADAIYVGVLVEEMDKYAIGTTGFDGFYTFLSFHNHTFGSTWFNWPYIQDFARDEELVFIPTVSPGYDDRTLTTNYPYTSRRDGKYYITAWARAVISRSRYVAINSFNDWVHGTQIESAQSKSDDFNDYGPEGPHTYISLTRAWAGEFASRCVFRVA